MTITSQNVVSKLNFSPVSQCLFSHMSFARTLSLPSSVRPQAKTWCWKWWTRVQQWMQASETCTQHFSFTSKFGTVYNRVYMDNIFWNKSSMNFISETGKQWVFDIYKAVATNRMSCLHTTTNQMMRKQPSPPPKCLSCLLAFTWHVWWCCILFFFSTQTCQMTSTYQDNSQSMVCSTQHSSTTPLAHLQSQTSFPHKFQTTTTCLGRAAPKGGNGMLNIKAFTNFNPLCLIVQLRDPPR